MATRVWGAGSGAGSDHDWDTAANWTGDTAPVDNDTVIFPSGAPDCTAGMTQTALNLALLIVDGFTNALGVSGTPLALDPTAATVAVYVNGGAGCELFLEGLITATTVLAGTAELGGEHTTVSAFGGTVGVFDTCAAVNVGRSQQGGSAPAVMIDSGATVATVNVARGLCTCSAGLTALNVDGGTHVQSAGNVATAEVRGGTFRWDAGNVTTCRMRGGVLDASQGTAARTVTLLERFSGSSVNLANGRRNIVVTTDRVFGGTEALDVGRTYALS